MQTNNRKIESVVNACAVLVMGVVVVFTIARLFFGAELSDEAYSVAETYMVSKGALPFVNNWSQMPGWTLLLAPFVKIYTFLVGGTDGIFLFFRFLSFFVNCLTAFLVAYLFRNHVKNKILLSLIAITYVGATGWDYVVTFRGDRLAIDLFAVGVALIIVFFADDKYSMKYLFISGILLSLSVLSYPTFVLEYLFFVIAIFVLCYRRRIGYKGLLFFLCGSVVSALVVVVYLSIRGGFTNIFSGIGYLLKDVAYFQLENQGISKFPAYMKTVISQIIQILKLSILPFVMFFVLAVILYFAIHRKEFVRLDVDNIYIRKIIIALDKETEFFTIKRKYIKQLLLISVIAGICLYHIKLLLTYKTADHTYISLYAMSAETLAVLLIWPFIKSEKRFCKYLMGLIWFPTFIWVVITGVGTYAGMIDRYPLLKNASFLLGLFVCFAVKDVFVSSLETDLPESKGIPVLRRGYLFLSKTIPIAVMMIISFTYLFNAYSYVYRDESFWRLNTAVESGPYKGMRTTKIRANGLIELDEKIDEFIDKDDYVLAMDNDPFIYLMSEGHICTPCTWDQALYSYHFDQPDLYYDYFKVTNTEPTKIVYFNYGRDEIMSIDVEYKFNDYVRANYDLIYEDRDIFEWNYCGKDNICELLIFDRK